MRWQWVFSKIFCILLSISTNKACFTKAPCSMIHTPFFIHINCIFTHPPQWESLVAYFFSTYWTDSSIAEGVTTFKNHFTFCVLSHTLFFNFHFCLWILTFINVLDRQALRHSHSIFYWNETAPWTSTIMFLSHLLTLFHDNLQDHNFPWGLLYSLPVIKMLCKARLFWGHTADPPRYHDQVLECHSR